jgi:ribosomal protein S18 acetylase RimI-like enzyme
MQKINVRFARKTEIKTITSYYHQLYKGDEKQKFYNSPINPANFRSGQFVLVADDGKRVIGYIWVVWYEHIKHKGIAYIEELYVDSKHRRKNVGKTLIDKCGQALAKRGINNTYVAVGKHMAGAKLFYGAIGFKASSGLWFER